MVFTVDSSPFQMYFGKLVAKRAITVEDSLADSKNQKLDFEVIDLFPNESERSTDVYSAYKGCSINLDVDVDQKGNLDFWRSVVIKVSSYNDLDHPDHQQRKIYQRYLKQEVSLAAYLGVYAIILPFPQRDRCFQYIKTINKIFSQQLYGSAHVFLEVPLIINESFDCWERYMYMKNLLTNKLIPLSLTIFPDLPKKELVSRFYGENIKCVHIKTSTFVSNTKGNPVLIPAHEEFIQTLFRFNINVIIETEADKVDVTQYRAFLCYSFSQQKELSECESMAVSMYDVLQDPLQPYKDHLESSSYIAFEEDVKKYVFYQEALEASYKKFPEDYEIFVLLVGAGRGPLIERALDAGEKLKRKVKVLAVEKNPFAMIHLNQLLATRQNWQNGVVRVIAGDIKDVKLEGDQLPDIIMSELLGSFGDNELSPEILLWAEKMLKPNTICIPSCYNSYVSPVSSQSLHTKVGKLTIQRPFENNHVVRMNHFYLPTDTQKCFTFNHPIKDATTLEQFRELEFEFKESNEIHGFAGYFDLILQDGVVLSTHPVFHTPEMESWFEIFFPFKIPVLVRPHQILKLFIWRKSGKKYIWYEWTAEIFCQLTQTTVRVLPIHNQNGAAHAIFL